jgi:hypothetical protein
MGGQVSCVNLLAVGGSATPDCSRKFSFWFKIAGGLNWGELPARTNYFPNSTRPPFLRCTILYQLHNTLIIKPLTRSTRRKESLILPLSPNRDESPRPLELGASLDVGAWTLGAFPPPVRTRNTYSIIKEQPSLNHNPPLIL